MKKYPRTPHLPWSPGVSPDDENLVDTSMFEGKEIVVTEKMDGECTTILRGGRCHARSLDTARHPSRSWVRSFAARFVDNSLFSGDWSDYELVGENLYATHSIHYVELPSYFLAFGIHTPDRVLAWDYLMGIEYLGIQRVPVLYRGRWDEAAVRACWTGRSQCGGDQEGYVVRLADGFPLKDFGRSVAKYVRAGHVQTDEHWLQRPVVPNGVISNGS